MSKSLEVELADKRGMEEASRLYRPSLLNIEEIRANEKKRKNKKARESHLARLYLAL